MKFGYARVSTADQNLALQTDALNAAGVDRIYQDTGSGSSMGRPGLDDLLSRVRADDTVVVWRLDRLARSLKDLIELAAQFNIMGVQLVLLQEGIDTTTSGGKLFFHIFGAVAEFERNLLIERTQAGLAAARSRGKRGGRKPVLDDGKQTLVRQMLDAAKTAGEEPNYHSIGACVGANERTIRRFASGSGVYKSAAVGSGSRQ